MKGCAVGEIAEMMLEGILCEGCGELMDDMVDDTTSPGYPRRCAGCSPQVPQQARRMPKPHIRAEIARNVAKKHVCPRCSKRFTTAHGVKAHLRDKHHDVG